MKARTRGEEVREGHSESGNGMTLSLGRNIHTHHKSQRSEEETALNLPSSPLGHYFHVEEELRRDSVCCPAKVRLGQLEGIPAGCPLESGRSLHSRSCSEAHLGYFGLTGSIVMTALPGQLTQC